MSTSGDVGARPRRIDLRTHLLDRHIIDVDGKPVDVVDDVEIRLPETGEQSSARPRITALVTGRGLLTRLSGNIPNADVLDRISISDVDDIGVAVTLRSVADGMRMTWPEDWGRDHLIAKIPGARR